jgi:hypothetical protein
MKTCSKCKQTKEEEEFYPKGKYRQAYCKKCYITYCMSRWVDKKIKAVEYKGGVCVDCGKEYHFSAMQFHHVDPSKKEWDWTELRKRSTKDIETELNKCILLCANCHALRNFKTETHLNYEEYLKYKENISPRVKKEIPKCKCGKEIKFKTDTGMCRSCYVISTRKTERPPKNILEDEIKEMSWVALGKKYGVSDNAIRKWATQYGIVYKKQKHTRMTGVEPAFEV